MTTRDWCITCDEPVDVVQEGPEEDGRGAEFWVILLACGHEIVFSS